MSSSSSSSSSTKPKYNRTLDPYPWPLICRVPKIDESLRSFVGDYSVAVATRPLSSAGDFLSSFFEITYFSNDGLPEHSLLGRFVGPTEIEQFWWVDGPPHWNTAGISSELAAALAEAPYADRSTIALLDEAAAERQMVFTTWLKRAVLGTETACVRRARRMLFDIERDYEAPLGPRPSPYHEAVETS